MHRGAGVEVHVHVSPCSTCVAHIHAQMWNTQTPWHVRRMCTSALQRLCSRVEPHHCPSQTRPTWWKEALRREGGREEKEKGGGGEREDGREGGQKRGASRRVEVRRRLYSYTGLSGLPIPEQACVVGSAMVDPGYPLDGESDTDTPAHSRPRPSPALYIV